MENPQILPPNQLQYDLNLSKFSEQLDHSPLMINVVIHTKRERELLNMRQRARITHKITSFTNYYDIIFSKIVISTPGLLMSQSSPKSKDQMVTIKLNTNSFWQHFGLGRLISWNI